MEMLGATSEVHDLIKRRDNILNDINDNIRRSNEIYEDIKKETDRHFANKMMDITLKYLEVAIKGYSEFLDVQSDIENAVKVDMIKDDQLRKEIFIKLKKEMLVYPTVLNKLKSLKKRLLIMIGITFSILVTRNMINPNLSFNFNVGMIAYIVILFGIVYIYMS